MIHNLAKFNGKTMPFGQIKGNVINVLSENAKAGASEGPLCKNAKKI